MQKFLLVVLLFFPAGFVAAQPSGVKTDRLILPVVNENQESVPFATIELLRSQDSALVRTGITDSSGIAVFEQLKAGHYFFKVSATGYPLSFSAPVSWPSADGQEMLSPMVLTANTTSLQGVTVVAKKPFIQQLPGKTIVNVDAAITNAGTTAMEVLEKSPGVTVDKDGNISLKGRSGVLIMIDNKPAYVTGTDLVNLLNGMSSTQIDVIELMTNPSAQYDAAGNAGIINIRTKKTKQKGFNGTLNVAYGQGRYYKNNNGLVLNYRNGDWNIYLNYSVNVNKGYTDLYALRRYFKTDGSVDLLLDQPSRFTANARNHTVRTGVDYSLNKKTTLGFALTGISSARKGAGNNTASWKDADGITDSVILTTNSSRNTWKNIGANFNLRYTINAQQDLTADADILKYDLYTRQAFQNNLNAPGGYEEAYRGNLPSTIDIVAAKADYTYRLPKEMKWDAGWKSSFISTDNTADYTVYDGVSWKEDLGKSNRFLYTENIHAVYTNFEKKAKRLTMQAGLRYERTDYKANQFGNSAQKDSSFSRHYSSLFPSASFNFEADSIHQFMFSAGRRIDRPAFQKLNPFLYIINKYTYQRGNSLIRPQYTWNLEFSHLYKRILTTTISYGVTKDYFSQLFLSNPDGTMIYTEGNFSRMRNFNASLSATFHPLRWWTFTGQATLNYKTIEGILWTDYKTTINQYIFDWNNQFKMNKGWSAELTGFYITRHQNDIQEILEPFGQLSAGIAKQAFKNKGTFRLTFRDIFYSQKMEGLTQFQQADEYFLLKRDSRVVTLGFTWRFGKTFKAATKRTGGANDEMQRVGNG
jgi:iron complex outermembrane receptor protein